MTVTEIPFRKRFYHHIPLFGWMARDLERDFMGNIGYALLVLATLLILAVKTWGLAALAMTALALVPVMFVLLIIIANG